MTNHQDLLMDLLIGAVLENDVDKVNELLHQGADPNHTLDDAGISALHHAAQNNSLHVIPLLIEAGALLFAQTEPEGFTPLDVALMHGNEKVAQLLLAYEQNIDESSH